MPTSRMLEAPGGADLGSMASLGDDLADWFSSPAAPVSPPAAAEPGARWRGEPRSSVSIRIGRIEVRPEAPTPEPPPPPPWRPRMSLSDYLERRRTGQL